MAPKSHKKKHSRSNQKQEDASLRIKGTLKLTDLPVEVLVSIVACLPLDPAALCRLRLVCRSFDSVIDVRRKPSDLIARIVREHYPFAHAVLGWKEYDFSRFRALHLKHEAAQRIAQLVADNGTPLEVEKEGWQSQFARYLLLVTASDQVHGSRRVEDYYLQSQEGRKTDMLLTMRYVSDQLADCTHELADGYRIPTFTQSAFGQNEEVNSPNVPAAFEKCFLHESTLHLIWKVLQTASGGPYSTGDPTPVVPHDLEMDFRTAVECSATYDSLMEGSDAWILSDEDAHSLLLNPDHLATPADARHTRDFALGTQTLIKRALDSETPNGDGTLGVIDFIGEYSPDSWLDHASSAAFMRDNVVNGNRHVLHSWLVNFPWDLVVHLALRNRDSGLRRSLPTPDDLLRRMIAARGSSED